MPPRKKKVITRARDKNHPAARNPMSERSTQNPKWLISVLPSAGPFQTREENGSSSVSVFFASETLFGDAIKSALRMVGKRKRVQKKSPKRPSSAAHTMIELCAVWPM